MSAIEPAIKVENLTIRYRSSNSARPALENVSFHVQPGEVVALLGPNGAGKTTALEAIEGYRHPDSGMVNVFGLDPAQHRNELARRWGVMPQAGGIPMGLTVGEAVRLFSELHGYGGDTRELIDAAGLNDLVKRRWRRLSGGEQQRLSLTLALCGGTDLLLLDEPTAAVDAEGRQRVLGIIQERARAGGAVLVTTHRFDDVEQIADRVIILDQGQVAAAGALDELTSGGQEIRFTAPPGLAVDQLGAQLDCPVSEPESGHYLVQMQPDPQAVATITTWLAGQGHTIGHLQAGTQSLEEVFLRVTGEQS